LNEKEVASILAEEIDEDILKKMPKWFKILRESYGKERSKKILGLIT